MRRLSLLVLLLLSGCSPPAPPAPTSSPPAAATPEPTPVAVVETPADPPSPFEANPFGNETPRGEATVEDAHFASEGQSEASQFSPTTAEVFLRCRIKGSRKLTAVRSVWTSREHPEVRSVDSQSLKPGPNEVELSMVRPGAGWPEGAYQVELTSAKARLGGFNFTVKGGASSAEETPSSPMNAVLNDDPEDLTPKSTFVNTGPRIHLHVDTSSLPTGTHLKAVWKAERVPGASGVLVNTEYTSDGGWVVFDLKPVEGRPYVAGDYRVDLLADARLLWTKPFQISP